MNQSAKNGVSKYLVWATIILVIAAVMSTLVFYLRPSESSNQVASVETSEVVEQESSSSEAVDTITYKAEAGTDALSQLKELNDTVVTKDSEYGEYVESINGLVGGTDGKYWSFYVNDELASVGAGEFMPEGGEEIKWHFVKL